MKDQHQHLPYRSMAFKLVNKFKRFSSLLLINALVLMPFFSSCSEDKPYTFHNSKEAITAYREFLSLLKEKITSNTDEFIKELLNWKEVNDSVYRYLQHDTTYVKPNRFDEEYFIIHDSVRIEMLRLSETWRYNYEDMLRIKEQTSSFLNDKDLQNAVEQAEPFFTSLNDTPLPDEDKKVLLTRYRYFLYTVKSKGITTKEDMLNFIRNEDILFRGFLCHINELDKEHVSDITKNTEKICHAIFIAARDGKISARDAMVYMSMRTVRRLLQNAVICMRVLSKNGVENKVKANAYVWMIIQPFISIDQFAIATLTPEQRSDFNYLVTQLPKSTRFARTFNIDQHSLNYLLPQQLLKIYILSL